jgi:hypothetical protein
MPALLNLMLPLLIVTGWVDENLKKSGAGNQAHMRGRAKNNMIDVVHRSGKMT